MIYRVVELAKYSAYSRESIGSESEVSKKSTKSIGLNSEIGVMLKVMLECLERMIKIQRAKET